MNLLLLLALAESHVVAVRPSATAACPAATEVAAALASRIPQGVVSFEQAGPRGALVLDIGPEGDQPASITLTDRQGQVKLRRNLRVVPEARPEAPPQPGSKDCAALAETAALIVERYLLELEYQLPAPPPPPAPAPPPPPPSRRWELAVASTFRPGSDGWSAFEMGPRIGRFFRAGRLLLSLGVAVGGPSDPVPPASLYRGQARQRRYPVDLGLWWLRGPSALQVELGGGASMDITRIRSEGNPGQIHMQTLPGPALWAAAAIRAPLGRKFYARLASSLVGSLIQYDFSARASPQDPRVVVFSAPTRRFYARIGLEVGLAVP